jgi:hypothetical protein
VLLKRIVILSEVEESRCITFGAAAGDLLTPLRGSQDDQKGI